MIKNNILTKRETEVINKKLANKKLSQQDSNYLSKYVRPKLREMSKINPVDLLRKIEYNQKSKAIERKIKKTILERIKKTEAIILYGSAIQNNYHDYNDIDIMIVTKSNFYKNEIEKSKKISEIKSILKKENIISDIEIISKNNLIKSYSNSPTLIYQLKDRKIIYGGINLPKKIGIYNADLHMKLDWSKLPRIKPTGNEVYNSLRNTILVRLLLNKIIDNSKLRESLNEELGKRLAEKLKNNQQSNEELKYSINYLNKLIKDTRKQIGVKLWEKIGL